MKKVKENPIKSTDDFADVVLKLLNPGVPYGKMHPQKLKLVEKLKNREEGLAQHHEAEVERAVEAEAYNWFNRWYNSHIAKQNEKQRFDFAQWATSRLQELGVKDNGTVAPTKTDKQTDITSDNQTEV